MRFTVMRTVDRYLGVLVCRIVALLLWVCRVHIRRVDHPAPPAGDAVREILVIKFLGLGSILQATPLFAALRKLYPGCRITLLTFHANRDLGRLGADIDRMVTVDTKGLWRFFRTNLAALWQLRRTRFDLVLNLEFYATYAALWTAFVRKQFAMGFSGFANYRDSFFHDFISYDAAQHIQEKYLAFARRLGYRGPTPPLFRLGVDDPGAVLRGVEGRLGVELPTRESIFLININTGEMAPHRRWPVEHYRVVVEELLRRPGVRCVLTGGPGDRKFVDNFQASLSDPAGVINLAGRISLFELVALMQVSDLYLGNDSGPLHFAACVGLPVFALFGPESPDVYGPPDDERNTALYRGEPCGPCLNVYTDKQTRCRDNICLKRIQPGEVLEILDRKYLRRRDERPPVEPTRVALPLTV
jgi:ADP-heptose:LPS heptosyltransferase